MEDLTQVQQDVLLQWLANARVTKASALGHTKSEMNARLVRLYIRELERRNVRVPTDDELFDVGVFNGVGST
jgi:hypothetical protein